MSEEMNKVKQNNVNGSNYDEIFQGLYITIANFDNTVNCPGTKTQLICLRRQ